MPWRYTFKSLVAGAAITIAIAFLVLVTVAVLRGALKESCPHRQSIACERIEFDSAQWKDFRTWRHPHYSRVRMVDDLIRSNVLIGMTRGEVEDLLGRPAPDYPPDLLAYWLDPPESPFDWLVIQLCGDKAIKAEHLDNPGEQLKPLPC
jgi:hypothetical protein